MLFINSTTDKVIQHDNREITEQNHSKKEELVETVHDPQPSSFPTIFSLAANRSKNAQLQRLPESISKLCRTEEISIPRSDGSHMTAYISIPEDVASFPLVIYIDGSGMISDTTFQIQTSKIDFSVYSYLFNLQKIGSIAIEKRGITADAVDLDEYYAYNTYENRLQDYIQLISQLEILIPNWNREILFLGSSPGSYESFEIGMKLNKAPYSKGFTGAAFPPYGEELKYWIKIIVEDYKIELNESEIDKLIEEHYELMLNHPSSFEKYKFKRIYGHIGMVVTFVRTISTVLATFKRHYLTSATAMPEYRPGMRGQAGQ
jgi:hypothetical protein